MKLLIPIVALIALASIGYADAGCTRKGEYCCCKASMDDCDLSDWFKCDSCDECGGGGGGGGGGAEEEAPRGLEAEAAGSAGSSGLVLFNRTSGRGHG